MAYGEFVIRRIKACLKRGRRLGEHAVVPVTPTALAAVARARRSASW